MQLVAKLVSMHFHVDGTKLIAFAILPMMDSKTFTFLVIKQKKVETILKFMCHQQLSAIMSMGQMI
jgi:hypothetical protein